MDRGRSEEVREVRSRLRWVPRMPPGAMVMSRSGLLLGPMMQPWSVLMPEAPDTTKGREDRTAELAPPLTGCNTRENWSCPSWAEALRTEDPAYHLGSKIELTLFAGLCANGPEGVRKDEQVAPSRLPCGVMDEGKTPSCPDPHQQHLGEGALHLAWAAQ